MFPKLTQDLRSRLPRWDLGCQAICSELSITISNERAFMSQIRRPPPHISRCVRLPGEDLCQRQAKPSGDLSGVTATWREGHGPERQVCDRAGGGGRLTPGISRWEVVMVVRTEAGARQR
ncbi:hypothetical protein AB1E18_019573 [Capra hircus]